MRKLIFVLASVFIMLFSMTAFNSQSADAHSSTRMGAGSWFQLSGVQSLFGTPNVLKESYGNITDLNWRKIMLGAGERTYWMKKMPFFLSDGAGSYAGYCAHSFIGASAKMNIKGLVKDRRIIQLVYEGSDGKYTTPSHQVQAGIQIALWGALNTNFSPELFTKYIALADSAYGKNSQTAATVRKIAGVWQDILNNPTKEIIAIKNAANESKGRCHNDPSSFMVAFPVQMNTLDGKPAVDVKKMADISVSGAKVEVVYGSDSGAAETLANYRITPDASHVYFIMKYDEDKYKGSTQIKIHVDYKDDYIALQHMQLLVYDSGEDFQPFLMATEKKLNLRMSLVWECTKVECTDIDPETGLCCPDGECPKTWTPQEPDEDIKIVPMHWHNLPLAFGEIKNGAGFNPTGVTTSGTFAQNRADEPFEAQLGVPSTEQFYVNMGGTEAFIDADVLYKEHKIEFYLKWQSPYVDTVEHTEYDASGNAYTVYEKVLGVENFDELYEHEFKMITITKASFRAMGDGSVVQGDLGISAEVKNASADPGSFTLMPSEEGLTPEPGEDVNFNAYGAEKMWVTSYEAVTSVFDGKPQKEDTRPEAEDLANEEVGQLFAQSDILTISVGSKTYEITDPSLSMKTAIAFKYGDKSDLDSTNGLAEKAFKPMAEAWSVYNHVPIKGYTGNPTQGAGRNEGGPVLIAENISIDPSTKNGVYDFEQTMTSNYVDYDEYATDIKGGEAAIPSDVGGLLDSAGNQGLEAGYGDVENPTDQGSYSSGNRILAHYTNFQSPVGSAGGVSMSHSGQLPDGGMSESIDGTPRYRSVNPILIHTPTSAAFVWIPDIDESKVEDQRVDAKQVHINTHDSVKDPSAPTRLYIDYPFEVHFGNTAAFDKYWYQSSTAVAEAGIVDGAYAGSGVLGMKDERFGKDAGQQMEQRFPGNPYGDPGWDVSKWTNAKYVKFPFAVYYDKADGIRGGSPKGFYSAGTWIELYNDNFQQKVGDPTSFNFRVVSSQKDIEAGTVQFAAQALNSEMSGGDEVFPDAEMYVNGTRTSDGKDAEAKYGAKNTIVTDVIGRIGNFIISDSDDPDFQSTFWDLDEKGKPNYIKPVMKEYGQPKNWFGTDVTKAKYSPLDRYTTMAEWRGVGTSMPLPMRYSKDEGKTKEAVQVGYSIGGSIQTLGDYDYNMWIYPQHSINGVPKTGVAGGTFKLVATDPLTRRIQEFYDSEVNSNLRSGKTGWHYDPFYIHTISNNLGRPNLKLSARERATETYQEAIQKGTGADTEIGTPSLLIIPRELRTFIGSDLTRGSMGSLGDGEVEVINSCDCPTSWANAQKWNFSFSFPETTQIIFTGGVPGDDTPEDTPGDTPDDNPGGNPPDDPPGTPPPGTPPPVNPPGETETPPGTSTPPGETGTPPGTSTPPGETGTPPGTSTPPGGNENPPSSSIPPYNPDKPVFEPPSQKVFIDTKFTARTKRFEVSKDPDAEEDRGEVSWDLATEITPDETFRTSSTSRATDQSTVGTH